MNVNLEQMLYKQLARYALPKNGSKSLDDVLCERQLTIFDTDELKAATKFNSNMLEKIKNQCEH